MEMEQLRGYCVRLRMGRHSRHKGPVTQSLARLDLSHITFEPRDGDKGQNWRVGLNTDAHHRPGLHAQQ